VHYLLQVDGDWRFDRGQCCLIWSIDLIDDTNRSGSMEFVVPAADPDVFYPVEVSFTANHTFCDITLESVVSTQTEGPVKYGTRKQLATAGYQVI
jgi:hypothetical protein